MMHDTSAFSQFSGLYGQSQPYGQQQYGQSSIGGLIPGFVPIVNLVPQALVASLVLQSLQHAQALAGHQTPHLGFAGPFGMPSGGMSQLGGALGQLGGPLGQPQQFGQFGQPQQFGQFGQPQLQQLLGQPQLQQLLGQPQLQQLLGQPQQQFGQPQQFGAHFGQPQQQFGTPFGQPQQFGAYFGQPQQQFGGPFGQSHQLGGGFGQSPMWGSPWQMTSWQLPHASGRGIFAYQPSPSMSYAG